MVRRQSEAAFIGLLSRGQVIQLLLCCGQVVPGSRILRIVSKRLPVSRYGIRPVVLGEMGVGQVDPMAGATRVQGDGLPGARFRFGRFALPHERDAQLAPIRGVLRSQSDRLAEGRLRLGQSVARRHDRTEREPDLGRLRGYLQELVTEDLGRAGLAAAQQFLHAQEVRVDPLPISHAGLSNEPLPPPTPRRGGPRCKWR